MACAIAMNRCQGAMASGDDGLGLGPWPRGWWVWVLGDKSSLKGFPGIYDDHRRWLVEGLTNWRGGLGCKVEMERNVDFMWHFRWGGLVVNEVVNPSRVA